MKLLKVHEISKWQCDNPYLLDYHRAETNSYKECVFSVFQLHNETLNIWTHLVGSILIIYMWYKFTNYGKLDRDDYSHSFMIHLFFLASSSALLISTMFHTLYCYNEKLKVILNKLDYLGILMAMSCSGIAFQYYLFLCKPMWQKLYTIIQISAITLFSMVLFNQYFQYNYNLKRKALVFTMLALSCASPVLHHLFIETSDMLMIEITDFLLFAVSASSAIIAYGCSIPERIFPGRFDIFCSSHQILHVCTFFALILLAKMLTSIIENTKC